MMIYETNRECWHNLAPLGEMRESGIGQGSPRVFSTHTIVLISKSLAIFLSKNIPDIRIARTRRRVSLDLVPPPSIEPRTVTV